MSRIAEIAGAIVLGGCLVATDAASLRGRILNAAGRPVAGAVVRMVPRGMVDTTAVDGAYAFSASTGVGSTSSGRARPRIEGTTVLVPVIDASPVRIEVLDVRGRIHSSILLSEARGGMYQWVIPRTGNGIGMSLVKVSVGHEMTMLRHVAESRLAGANAPSASVLARVAAISDTLEVVARGYSSRRIALASSDTVLDVTLDSLLPSGIPLRNVPRPSAGCGKANSLKSGTYKITSAGLAREYILSLPAKYDPAKPSRLIFGMHWMNGSADAVQGWSKWFGLQALDTAKTTIFVAPNGYGNPPLWTQGAKDHALFDDLLKHLKTNLCLDTSRVFSVGFSFGAMFTNSLAQTHQDVLRGVVTYAAADYNIYFPANTGKPLAYMGVHGLKDPTCPISAGRSSRDRFVKNNACTQPSSVPEAKSGGAYVTYDYKCPENLPVRWITFDGAHTYPPNNNGTWVHGKTWEFITKF